MSETVSETTGAPSEQAFSLGSVNVDSLKGVLSQLSEIYPFVDETAKLAFVAQINGLHEAGNPYEAETAGAIITPVSPTETTAPATPAIGTPAPVVTPTAETATLAAQGGSAEEIAALQTQVADLQARLAAANPTANQQAENVAGPVTGEAFPSGTPATPETGTADPHAAGTVDAPLAGADIPGATVVQTTPTPAETQNDTTVTPEGS